MMDRWLNKVICGDALELLPQLPDKCVDLVLTDPPFGHKNNDGDLISMREKALGHGEPGEARPIANDGPEANDIFKACLPEWNRLLRHGGCCCCCCCGGGPDPMFARWSLWMDEVFDFKQMVVWDKGPMGMGWHYRRSYETILVAQKRGDSCNWYDETNKIENIIRPTHKMIRKIIPQANQHPTVKPVQLMEHFIKLHTKPGDIVLDPFLGSGTTAVAAINTGRNYIGFEIDQYWVDYATKRIAQETAQERMFV
jgi:site-specific DNA-methyltransferase (adenine-specific)